MEAYGSVLRSVYCLLFRYQQFVDFEDHAPMLAIHVWTRQRIMVYRYTT